MQVNIMYTIVVENSPVISDYIIIFCWLVFSDDAATTTYHSAAEGERLELDCSREQASDVITWYKDGRVFYDDFNHVFNVDGAVLTIRDLRSSDRGRYECTVTDRPTGDLIRRHTFVVTEGGPRSFTITCFFQVARSNAMTKNSCAFLYNQEEEAFHRYYCTWSDRSYGFQNGSNKLLEVFQVYFKNMSLNHF